MMCKTIFTAICAIGIYAAALDRGINPITAVAAAVGMACLIMYSYYRIELMDKEYEERKKRRCQRERAKCAEEYGGYPTRRTSNRHTYAHYAKDDTAEKANVSNIVVVAGKGNTGSSTGSRKPIRKICGVLSYDYYGKE